MTQALSKTSADPETVAMLFARDPLELTTEDIDVVIMHMRDRRHQFKTASSSGKKAPAAPKLTKAEKEIKASGLDVSGIEL